MAPTLVLLHGFTHTGASWDRVVAALGERYLPVAPDIRGHGSASATAPVTLEAVIEDVAALAPGTFELAGYSMGGRIALHVALALPERVRRLILVGASPGIEDAGERARRRAADEQLAQEAQSSTVEAFAQRWAKTPVLGGLPPDAAAAAHRDRLRSTPAGLAAALRGLGTGALPPLWGRLGELRIPVSLLVGERDEKFRRIATQMASRMADPEVIVVPRAGHAVHLEAPNQTAAAIVA